MSRIEEFLSLYKGKSTVTAYRWALAEFFKSVYGENGHKLEELGDKYFTDNRDYEKDITKFLAAINDKPPKSVRLMLSAVKSFLIENRVELTEKFWRGVIRRVKGSRARTQDKVPSNVELRQILTHTPVQGTALFLTLASSGMRIGEALQLKLEDLSLDNEPAKVSIRGSYTKTGNSRIAFISREATETIQQWLRVREDYLSAASKKSRYEKSAEDDRLFPFEHLTAYVIWKNAVRKAGFLKRDPETNRHTVHPHTLRKFFRSKMSQLIPVDIVEALMGHEGYLTEVYRRYSEEDLAKFYLQGESAVLIFTEAGEVRKLRAEVEERNKQLQTLANGLASENLELKDRVRSLEQQVGSIQSFLKDLDAVNKWIIENIPIPEGGPKLTKEDVERILKRQQT